MAVGEPLSDLVDLCGHVAVSLTTQFEAAYRALLSGRGGVVRKALALLSAFSVGVGGAIPGQVLAQQSVPVAAITGAARPIDPIVLATFKAYPAGGTALTERIRLLLLQSNYLANDVARAITRNGVLNPRQRAAGQEGLAQALSRLGAERPPPPSSDPGEADPSGLPAAPGGLVDQVPPTAAGAGLSDAQWTAIVGGLAIGGGALGFGIYELTKKVSPN
jgi:hypothetical protein